MLISCIQTRVKGYLWDRGKGSGEGKGVPTQGSSCETTLVTEVEAEPNARPLSHSRGRAENQDRTESSDTLGVNVISKGKY